MVINVGDQLWYRTGDLRVHEYTLDIEEVHPSYIRVRHTLEQHREIVFNWYFGGSPRLSDNGELLRKFANGTATIIPREEQIVWEV
jgi:hypothetical protein